MAKQTFTTGQVLTAAQMTSLQQTAMGGGSTTAKTVSYTLVAADAGTVVQMNSASATTITVNTALFAAGDTVQIQNIGAGVCTVTAGTATVSTAGSLALSQYEGGQLYFTATGASVFFDVIQSAGGLTLAQIATGSMASTSVTISSLSAYDTIMLSLTGVTWGTAADNIRVRINSLTSSSYLKNGFAINTSRIAINSTGTSFALQDSGNQANADANNNYFYVFTQCKAAGFTGVQAVGRYVDSTTASTAVSVNGVIISNEAVSSLVIATSNAYTFSAGTYTVWGA